VPLTPEPTLAANRGSHYLSVIGRVAPGVTTEGAAAQLREIAARLERAYPEDQSGRSVLVKPLSVAVAGSVRPALLVLIAAVALLLAIACANVANLALARANVRRREIAVRSALGAGLGRLVRQSLTESLLLALGATLLGALVGRLTLSALAASAARVLPDVGALTLSGPTLLFLAGVGLATGLVLGLVPAFATLRPALTADLVAASRGATGGRARQRMRRSLVVSQVALSLALLIGAGLLLRTFFALEATPPGFDSTGVLTLHLAVPSQHYPQGSVATRLLEPLVERTEALPGVVAAGWVDLLPLQEWGNNSAMTIVGRPEPPPGEEWWVETRFASPRAIAALGIPLRAGRPLADADAGTGSTPFPVVVNEAFVHRFFPNASPLGAQLHFEGVGVMQVVGVVGDTRQGGLDREPLPELTALGSDPRLSAWIHDVAFVVRTRGRPADLTPAIRGLLAQIAPQQPIHDVETLSEVVAASLADRRLTLPLTGAFALLAALLAGAGLYALAAYSVAQRAREIGIRMALGAAAGQILRAVLRENLGLTACGLATGSLLAWGGSRLLASQLYGVGAFDLRTWASVTLLLLAVTLAASLVPAARAARLDPAAVLHDD